MNIKSADKRPHRYCVARRLEAYCTVCSDALANYVTDNDGCTAEYDISALKLKPQNSTN